MSCGNLMILMRVREERERERKKKKPHWICEQPTTKKVVGILNSNLRDRGKAGWGKTLIFQFVYISWILKRVMHVGIMSQHLKFKKGSDKKRKTPTWLVKLIFRCLADIPPN